VRSDATHGAACLSNPRSEGLVLAAPPLPVGAGSYFLDSLLLAGLRWPIWDRQAESILVLIDTESVFSTTPSSSDSARSASALQMRIGAAAALAWCWIMREIPARTPSSPWLLVPVESLLFALRLFYQSQDFRGLSRKALVREASLRSRHLWVRYPRLAKLLSENLPRAARNPSQWEQARELDPVEDGLGSQPSLLIPACAILGLPVPASAEACRIFLSRFHLEERIPKAAHHCWIREFTAAVVWASASVVVLDHRDISLDSWIPFFAFTILQSILPEVASGWEWANGHGLG